MAGIHNIILFYRVMLFTFMTLTILAANIKTPLYKRCGHFKKVNQSYKCLEYQNYGCQAQKISSNSSETSFCTTGTCPPDPLHLTLTHYRKQRYVGGAKFTGLNISWAMDTQDGSYQYLDGFRLTLSSSDLVYVIKMRVNVTEQPVDHMSKMWFRFDCFYPVPKNQNWMLTVIQIPYDPKSSDVGALKNFTLDTYGDLVSPPQLSPTSTMKTPSTERISWSETSTAVIMTPSTSEKVFPKGQEIIYGHPTSINGVLIGVFSAVLVILFGIICICFIQRRGCLVTGCKHCKIGITHPFRRKGNTTSRPTNILNNTDNFNQQSERKLLLLYTERSTEHVQRVQELSNDLGNLCQVIHLSNDQTKNGHNDYLQDLIEKADFIIIVSSDHTVKTVGEVQRDFLASSTDAACALRILLRAGEKISSRVVTIYYPEEKHLQILNSISMWCPIALPANLNIVLDWIQHGKYTQLVRAASVPDEETRSGQVCCAWSNTMDPSCSECTSVKCLPDSAWQDSGFQEPGVCSWPSGQSHARQVDEVDITQGCERSFSFEHPHPGYNTQSSLMWRQNPANDYANTSFDMGDSGDNNQTHPATHSILNRYPSAFSGYYKPPHDCNSINTDISSYVDAINSE